MSSNHRRHDGGSKKHDGGLLKVSGAERQDTHTQNPRTQVLRTVVELILPNGHRLALSGHESSREGEAITFLVAPPPANRSVILSALSQLVAHETTEALPSIAHSTASLPSACAETLESFNENGEALDKDGEQALGDRSKIGSRARRHRGAGASSSATPASPPLRTKRLSSGPYQSVRPNRPTPQNVAPNDTPTEEMNVVVSPVDKPETGQQRQPGKQIRRGGAAATLADDPDPTRRR